MEITRARTLSASFYLRLRRLVVDPKGVFTRKKHALRRRVSPVLREQDRLSKLTGPAGYWEELRAYQLSFLKTMGLQPNHSLLDIGCGPLQGGVAFISYLGANKYVGVDVSKVAIQEAYRQVAKNEALLCKNPRLVLSHSFGLEELGGTSFDYAWACQMLYHLDADMIKQYFEGVSAQLKPGGLLYADVLGEEARIPEGTLWNGFRHIVHGVGFVESVAEQNGLSMRLVGRIEDYGYPVPCVLRYNRMLEFRKL